MIYHAFAPGSGGKGAILIGYLYIIYLHCISIIRHASVFYKVKSWLYTILIKSCLSRNQRKLVKKNRKTEKNLEGNIVENEKKRKKRRNEEGKGGKRGK